MYDGVIKDQSIPLPLLTQAKGLAVRDILYSKNIDKI
jgi:hypothetical protein